MAVKIVELTKQVKNEGVAYTKSLDILTKRVLYDNLDRNETLAVAPDHEIRLTKKDDFRGNIFKEKEVLFAIRKHIADEDLANKIFELVKHPRSGY